MAAYSVSDGTDWIQSLVFGSAGERWRLDSFDLAMTLRSVGDPALQVSLSLANGRLVVKDAAARRLDINLGWPQIEALAPGPFEFDVLFVHRSTGVRSRSERCLLTVTPAITELPA